MQYLQKRKDPKTGMELDNWRLCVPIPKLLQSKAIIDPLTGKPLVNRNGGPVRLYRKTLGTSDRKAAEKIARPIINNLKMQFDALATSGEYIDLGQVAIDAIYRSVLGSLNAHLATVEKGSEASVVAKRQADLLRLSRDLMTGDAATFDAMADRIIANRALDIPKGSVEYRQLVEYAQKSTIDALHVFVAELQGGTDAKPKSAVLRDALSGKLGKSAKAAKFQQYGEIRIA